MPSTSATEDLPRARSEGEFIALVALTTSLVAMSIDSMLPALGVIASELGAARANDRQLILTLFYAGLTVGQLVYGPVSDSTGRRPALLAGLGLFVAGGLLCWFTRDFRLLLAGRVLQGFGAAGPRVVAMALVRDVHTGRAMARVMSFVSTLFILVPIAAPAVGQAVASVASWRGIFAVLVCAGVLNAAWFSARQPETLPVERRAPFSLVRVARAAREAFGHRITRSYTFASGLVFGGFLTYLTSSQQLLQEQYGLGAWFPAAFGALAASLGLASFTNAKLVMRFGMRRLSRWAICAQCCASLVFLPVAWWLGGHPPFAAFFAYLAVCFFCNGLLFGNYNGRAMEPMGHIAGVAAAVTGSVSSMVALAAGTVFGRLYDGTVRPLVGAFAVLGVSALLLTEWAEADA